MQLYGLAPRRAGYGPVEGLGSGEIKQNLLSRQQKEKSSVVFPRTKVPCQSHET